MGGRGVGEEGMGGSEEDESAGASGAPHPAELRVPASRPEAMTRAGAVRRGAARRGTVTPGRGDAGPLREWGEEGMGGSEEDESAGASGAPHPAELRVPARRPEAMTRAGAVRRGAA